MWPDFERECNEMRGELKILETRARKLALIIEMTNNSEVVTQANLAMRHIEDARMRYGKVIQYLGDGESIYDENTDKNTDEDTDRQSTRYNIPSISSKKCNKEI